MAAGAAFSLNIEEWVKRTKRDVDKVCRAITIELFTRVVLKTPVDTGRARGNWQMDIDKMPTGTLTLVDKNRHTKIAADLAGRPVAGHVAYLVNNLPYIGVLEYGGYPNPPKKGSWVKGRGYDVKSSGGFSRQAPAGMVRISVQEISDVVQKGIAKGKKNG